MVKRFGDFIAVDAIDFELRRGESFGFLGPNGAGKSSTMRMIGCVSPPSGGELSILGLDPVADGPVIRARLGVVPQEDTLDLELTVRENLLVYGRYFGLSRHVIRERTARLLDFVQLTDRAEDSCYQVTDVLPAGLRAVTDAYRRGVTFVEPGTESSYPYSIEGGRVHFCAFRGGEQRPLVYYARVAGPGRFGAEPALIRSLTAAAGSSQSDLSKVHIR